MKNKYVQYLFLELLIMCTYLSCDADASPVIEDNS